MGYLRFPEFSLVIVFMKFAAIANLVPDGKITKIIFRVNSGIFEIHRKIPKFSLLIIIMIFDFKIKKTNVSH